MKLLIATALLTLASTAAFANEDILRCEFGKGECHARIRSCPTSESECHEALTVDCAGYEDGFLTRRDDGHVLVQGITSLRNPTPPSIVINIADGDAVLFASFGSLQGRCHENVEN
jgi:hypothetical protein